MNNLTNTHKKITEQQIEAERMQDVLLLLQNLTDSQEATLKLIIDCVYDVASINLINQKFRSVPLKRLTKLVARMSKPAFKVFAWYWFKKNCPQLIVNWLRTQIAFTNSGNLPKKVAVEVLENQTYLPAHSPLPLENQSQEIYHLRSQVRLLAGISIIALSTLGFTFTSLYLNSQIKPSLTQRQIQLGNNALPR